MSLLPGCGLGLQVDSGDELAAQQDARRTVAPFDVSSAQKHSVTLSREGDYTLVSLGSAEAGDQWTFSLEAAPGVTPVLVFALFDSDYNLLDRNTLTVSTAVQYTLRRTTGQLYAGLQATANTRIAFDLLAARQAGLPVPQPATQVVWLSFDGARDLSIHNRTPISFGPFTAADIDPRYAEDSALIKAEIARTLRATYGAYNVVITSSDESPAPAEPHSTIYFGGNDSRYLGLGDGVDRGNENVNDQAIVYVQAFAAYAPMQLTAEQIGRMLGNVAGHELGHLLGLYHTRNGQDLMDDSPAAWDLLDWSSFTREQLAEAVFPIGLEDSARVLAETVGWREAR